MKIITLIILLALAAMGCAQPIQRENPMQPSRLKLQYQDSPGYPLLFIVSDSKTGREFLLVNIGGKPAICPMQ